jgi:serine protease AprX
MLWFQGIVVVASSGNLGAVPDAVSYAPANDPYIIVVGAVDDVRTKAQTDDFVTDWSSRGVTQDGFAKPDVLAPGSKIISNIYTSSYLATHYPSYLVDSSYFTMSGTSMASPVGAGVVALLLEQNPSLSPGQVKYVLTHTGNSAIGDNHAKELDAYQATFYAGNIGNTDNGLTPNSLVGTNGGSLTFNSTIKWDSFPDK